MEVFKIEYRLFPDEYNVIIVTANSPEEAVEKANIHDAYMYHIRKYVPYKLGNKSYSRRLATYNAMWLDDQGKPAFWGSYNPFDGSYYLSTPDGTLSSGMWVERWDGDYEFESIGSYSFNEIRRALQLGVFI